MKKYFKIQNSINFVDMTQVLPMKPAEFKISLSVESYDEKTA